MSRNLFQPSRHPCRAILVEVHRYFVGRAADPAILDIALTLACRGIEGDDDLFAAGAADITSFVGEPAAFFVFLGLSFLNGWQEYGRVAIPVSRFTARE